MAYYPLSQIKTNLFTNGGEFYIPTSDTDIRYYSDSSINSYIGFYWKTSSEKYFTGKNPQSNNILELKKYIEGTPSNNDLILSTDTPIKGTMSIYLQGADADLLPENALGAQQMVYTYTNIKDIERNRKILIPTYILPRPTTQEYQQGYFTRYFCKKSNEFVYLEIDKDTYDKLKNKDPKILYQLYVPFTLKWQLAGDKEKVYNTNKNMIELVMRDQKMYLLNRYLKENYTQFWKSN